MVEYTEQHNAKKQLKEIEELYGIKVEEQKWWANVLFNKSMLAHFLLLQTMCMFKTWEKVCHKINKDIDMTGS
jgi:hypothetical protein